MTNTETIKESVKYLSKRFSGDLIKVNWRDRQSFDTLLNYFSEISEDDLDVMYLRRCLTYIACQYAALTFGDNNTISLEGMIMKLEQILKADSKLYTLNVASDMIASQVLRREQPMDESDFVECLDDLVSDVIKYNTRNGFQRISN